MFYAKYANRNPYNTDKKRNTRNTDYQHYNCAGYALNCFSWYQFSERIFSGKYTIDDYVKELLSDFSNLRVITSEKDLLPNEYMIAFRLSRGDFHFIRRGRNGVWHHKRGGSRGIETISKEKVFSEAWHHRYGSEVYTGKIVFLAVAN